MVSRFNELRVFDWNATDAAIFRQVQSNNLSLAAVYGSAVGNSAGWLTAIAVGAGLGMVFPVIGGRLLATAITSNVAAEAIEDMVAALRVAIGQTITVSASNAALLSYVGIRRLMKSPQTGLLERVFGLNG